VTNGRCGQLVRAAVFGGALWLSAGAWETAAHADADGYVLALSWQPGFCASDAGADKPECADPPDAQLTLHGLWPNADRNADGRVDADDDYCLGADRARLMALDKRDWAKLPPVALSADLRQHLAEIMPGMRSQLERHQWVKHGSCSGLGAEHYFTVAVALSEAVRNSRFGEMIQARAGDDVARRDLLRAFAAAFGTGSERALQLLCRRDGDFAHLSEIRLRLTATAVADPLSRDSFDTSRAAKGNCPARFSIERD
jgi:ribonuclease T2